eukprot:3917231-Pleurochrysis_carterae.AAC.1
MVQEPDFKRGLSTRGAPPTARARRLRSRAAPTAAAAARHARSSAQRPASQQPTSASSCERKRSAHGARAACRDKACWLFSSQRLQSWPS